jgi:lysophospholipase L1-like esterase
MGANWAAIDHLGFPAGVTVHNVSTNGQGLQTALGRRETDLFPFFDAQKPSVLLLQQGTNDLGPGSLATGGYLYAVLKTFVESAHSIGFYVVVDTLLPRQDSKWTPAMEQQRLEYNKLVRANAAGADAVNDIASDPVIGDGTNPATSAYYGDGLHPTVLGQERLAVLNAAALGPLLQCPARTSAH